ncbi:hypothetical protein PGS_00002030 [Porphyromonas gingivalis A7A1-28]|nr:hypothetical protein PGS_00002030 [Porphyromonas gingivalis A7A1-28]
MNNVNDRAPTAPSPISGSKPFMWRTVGAKVKPFSESAKSNGSFFRADAQEKTRRLILPLKRIPTRSAEQFLYQSGRNRFCGHKSTPFFFTDKPFKIFFQPVRQKNSPRRKGLPPKKEDKREHIYNMFARVRETQKERKRNRMRREKNSAQKDFSAPKRRPAKKGRGHKGERRVACLRRLLYIRIRR